MFWALVKSRINAEIRRNSKGLFILYNNHTFIEFGFVRMIFAVLPPRAHHVAAVRHRVQVAHVG